MTLLVSACGLLIGAAIGGLVAWARLSGRLLAGGIGQAYAALFRGLPELLIVYFVYFGTSTLLTETAHALGLVFFVRPRRFHRRRRDLDEGERREAVRTVRPRLCHGLSRHAAPD